MKIGIDILLLILAAIAGLLFANGIKQKIFFTIFFLLTIVSTIFTVMDAISSRQIQPEFGANLLWGVVGCTLIFIVVMAFRGFQSIKK